MVMMNPVVTSITVKLNDETWRGPDVFIPETGAFGVSLYGAPDGLHTLLAKSWDAAGNCSLITSATVIVDTIPPEISINEYLPDPTANITLVFTGTTSDTAGLGVDFVEVKLNGGEWTSATVALLESGDYVTTFTNLADGQYVVYARATDKRGNISAVVVDSIFVDATPPVVSLTEYEPDPTSLTTVVYHGIATDNGGSGVSLVEVKVNAGSWVQADNYDSQTSAFSHSFSSLTDGAHVFTARARDVVSNLSEVSTDSLTIDTVGPVSIIDMPQLGEWTSGSLTVHWYSPDGDVDFFSPTLVWIAFDQVSSGTWPVQINDVLTTENSYLLNVEATDLVGNVGTSDTVIFGIDQTSPSLSMIALEPGLQDIVLVDFIGEAWDNYQSGIERVEYSLNAGAWNEATTTVLAPIPTDDTRVVYGVTLNNPSETTHTLSLRTIDKVGNVSLVISTQFAIDHSAPIITVETPDSGTTLTGSVSVEIHVADIPAGIDASRIQSRSVR